ncbi:hypothetical protein [Kordiimonas sp.]|uniref:hypothetical protein n=1 Tax=Kordiimonas sp. TaxID=1970157 RepID=UPI003A92F7FB
MSDTKGKGEVVMAAADCQMVYMLYIQYGTMLTAWKNHRGEELKPPTWVVNTHEELVRLRGTMQAVIDKQARIELITSREEPLSEIRAPQAMLSRISDLAQWTLERWHELNGTECPPKSRWYRPAAEEEGAIQ